MSAGSTAPSNHQEKCHDELYFAHAAAGARGHRRVCSLHLPVAYSAEPNVKSLAVSYADLDLSKSAGAQTLYKRIKKAARRVCGPVDNYTFLTPAKTFRQCYEQAIADAVAQVDRPSLTALHQDETSRTASG